MKIKKEGLLMEVLQKNNVFLGLLVGGLFTLVPASDTGWRPEELIVEGSHKTLILHGGTYLTAEIASEGILREKYLQYLSTKQRKILAALAFDLTGRLFFVAGYNLQKKVEKLGEEEVIFALQNLFKGVEEVERVRGWLRHLSALGERLDRTFFPVTSL
ncbi:MAG: hypothetical protein ABH841_00715 [Candidatus Nealsonbacteria bacterium]